MKHTLFECLITFLRSQGARLPARTARGGDESGHTVRTVEWADNCRVARVVGWYARLVCGGVSSERKIRCHNERVE